MVRVVQEFTRKLRFQNLQGLLYGRVIRVIRMSEGA
jgi:hypothetical protein